MLSMIRRKSDGRAEIAAKTVSLLHGRRQCVIRIERKGRKNLYGSQPCIPSWSFSRARFSMRDTYDRLMPHCWAISR